MNSSELNAWRDELYLNFGSIREAKQYFAMMNARYELASQKVDELLDESKANMKGELKPIYLHRSSDSAARSLKWKLSAAKCFGFANAARAISLLSEDVISILRQAEGVSDELIRDVVEMDFKRCYLNYALNYSYHEMKRVELFIEEFESWRKLPRLLNENYS
ncbi:hypothetical protein THMIRHAS_17090 [Thiosulfatimonas sediminis]|uniref:Uncharacterized protein n=1 Tax=Thiosulfatimonas sediminis TaxID=2675054 RepID=A0A6F8PW63_9GAMM|nr:hypothetical protein [Thiosulfatimonas sediminis]BBP46336.1 hypothetical protein THMIRHAS_17090 [Thiosulfatimonas sediminis]